MKKASDIINLIGVVFLGLGVLIELILLIVMAVNMQAFVQAAQSEINDPETRNMVVTFIQTSLITTLVVFLVFNVGFFITALFLIIRVMKGKNQVGINIFFLIVGILSFNIIFIIGSILGLADANKKPATI